MKSWTEKFNAPKRVAIKPAPADMKALERDAPMETITPFRRVLDRASPTTKRLSFGAAFVEEKRREEGLPE